MLKKILLIIVIIFFGVNMVSAKEVAQIELSISKSEVEIGDVFQVFVSIKNANMDGLNIGNIVVPGLENFQKTGSSQSTKIQIMNGITTAITETVLTFKALNVGEYDIGPIGLKSGSLSIQSNIEQIKVIEKEEKKSFFKNSVSDEEADDNSSQVDQSKTEKNNSKNGSIKDVVVNVLAFALLCGLLFAFYKQKQYKKEDFRETRHGASVQGEEESEIKQADNKQDIPTNDDPKFFVKIKNIIFTYLQDKYKIKVEALTSQEIVEQLKSKKIHDTAELEKALDLCDRGSFSFNEEGKEELINIVKLLK